MAKHTQPLCINEHGISVLGVVRDVGDGRYEAYMIPPDKANHASFLEQLPTGELLMAWFSGTKEGANKCSIVMAHLPANGSQVRIVSLPSFQTLLSLAHSTYKTNTSLWCSNNYQISVIDCYLCEVLYRLLNR